MRLIHKDSGKEAAINDLIWRGNDIGTIEGFSKPHKPSAEGTVVVKMASGEVLRYYVSVVGLKWIEREDRDD